MERMARRAINKLTDRGIKAWIARARSGSLQGKIPKLSDGGGMFLTVTPAGTPIWRVKYRMSRKEKTYTVGAFPSVSLDQARLERDWVKAHLREGRDPVTARRVTRATALIASDNAFGTVAADWLERQRVDWSDVHYAKSKRALERDVLPLLAKLPVTEVTPVMVASIIEAIARRGARDTAAKVLWQVSGVFRLAQARGLCTANPAEPVSEVLAKKQKSRKTPAALSFTELGDILRRAEAAPLSRVVHLAHRLCAFTTARIGNVVAAQWKDFDLSASPPTWIIPRSQMKAKDREHDHKVVLCPEIVNELRKWQRLIGKTQWVFPSRSTKTHVTRESVEKAYRVTLGLDGKHSPHGWRAAFSTLARDNGYDRDVVELILDHIHDNEVARAYDRGQRMAQRITLMRWWGEQLAQAQQGGEVVPLKHTA